MSPFIINFIRSFKTERSQFVCVAGRSSDLMSPNSGVPQGTIMGPPCFNLAYDDLKIDEDVNYHSECQMIKFADDNNPIIGVKNGRDCTEETLRMIYEWCESNNFLLNCSKTKQLTIKLKSTIQPIPSSIENQESLKILGLFFDTHLTFETHVNFICKKVCSDLYLLNKLKHHGYKYHDLNLLLNSLVLPKLTYCCTVWGGCSASLLGKIDRLQKRAKRMGFTTNYIPIKEVIASKDKELYHKILKEPHHLLFDIIPTREEYSMQRL